MTIWQLTEYFMAVSIVALFILAMKKLFHDKLDARWHYLIWIVLGVRMVAPLSLEWLKSPLSLFEAIPVNYWVKLLEYKAKRAGALGFIQNLLWVYAAGVIVFAGYYIFVAVKGRIRIQRLEFANREVCDYVAEIAANYDLKPCKRIKIGEGAMPCVCGLFQPTLVLPKESVAEEVVVHELLHKKYGDVWINYTLHLVRVLNWFNPLIWYVTSVILNDSEALCDQRVLEYMEKKQQREETQQTIEKIYGTLLLNMAREKGAYNAKIGTTNMANSYRNMHTRIKRIADFRRVPEGVGFAALCITVVLIVSSISYCEGAKIVSSGVENKQDLERVMTRAMLYEAETKEQAIYLYLKAIKEMNPIYLLAVTPNAELSDLEAWIWDMFEQDKFVRWIIDGKSYIGNSGEATYYSEAKWLNFRTDIIENPWFVWDGSKMKAGWIYNTNGDETAGSADVELYVEEESKFFVNWDLELLYENGWKVQRVGEEVFSESRWKQTPQPMLMAEGIGKDWIIRMSGYNEAYFSSLFHTNSGWQVYSGSVPTMEEYEKSVEYPLEFDMQYKNSRVSAVYQGEEALEGKEVNIVFQLYTEAEFAEKMENGFSVAEIPLEKLQSQAIYDNKNYSSSDGNGSRFMDGKQIKNGEEILVTGGGSGPDGWAGAEELHFIAWIYYDGECVEVIRK